MCLPHRDRKIYILGIVFMSDAVQGTGHQDPCPHVAHILVSEKDGTLHKHGYLREGGSLKRKQDGRMWWDRVFYVGGGGQERLP